MNAIEIKNLTKSYNNFKLDNLNLTLPSGSIMGLIGENGAGKSTTIKLILDMIRLDSGSIRLLGHDNKTGLQLLKEDIGIVLDTVGLSGCLKAVQVEKIMKLTFKNWQTDTFYSYLEKLDLPSEKPFKDYSNGMKMKLGIAVALSHNPKLLILDEPTNGLDPVVRDEVVDILNDFTRDENNSILISSHIVSDLEKLCDYIAFLHKGKLILCEEKDELLQQYCIVHFPSNLNASYDLSSVIGQKKTPYGTEAIMKRSDTPSGANVSSISIEELFVFMVKGVK